MPKLSHEAFGFSSPDLQRGRYQQSIDPLTWKQGQTYAVYEARLRSERGITDPKDGKTAVVKFRKNMTRQANWPQLVQETAKRAWRDAQSFNSDISRDTNCSSYDFCEEVYNKDILDGLQGREGVLTFLVPQSNVLTSTATMDKLRNSGEAFLIEDKLKSHKTFLDDCGKPQTDNGSIFTKLLRPLSKKRSRSSSLATSMSSSSSLSDMENSGVFAAEDTPPSYEDSQAHAMFGTPLPSRPVFSLTSDPAPGSRSRSSTLDSEDGLDPETIAHPILQAFVHHAFHQNKGRLVYCNLKGYMSKRYGHYVLSPPAAHSIGGPSSSKDVYDNGVTGIRNVIDNHQCSRLCCHLPSMAQLLDGAIGQSMQNH